MAVSALLMMFSSSFAFRIFFATTLRVGMIFDEIKEDLKIRNAETKAKRYLILKL